jgi:hypothetical protein
MKKRIFGSLLAIAFMIACSDITNAQGTTATLSGTVLDQSGAAVSGAGVTVRNKANGAEFQVRTSDQGLYTVPALGAGVYLVTIEASGFKKAVIEDVKLDVGVPATVNVSLEIGVAGESVVVQGGAEVLQTQSANVSTTITGRQITDLPFTSRDALDLVLLLPGTNTPGRPRSSTINGLPKGSINITMDGVNVQDNMLKSSDGFFTYVRPRIDAVDEVTVSTATPGAESSGEGAVGIKFVTRSGNNEFHGSVYEYHRNPAMNANYWFNNRDTSYDVQAARACGADYYSPNCKSPRDRVLVNQYGFRIGGPFLLPKKLFGPAAFDGRDKAFFFVNYEEFRIPEQSTRQRTILNRDAQRGIFRYPVGGGATREVNLLDVSKFGSTATPDPITSKLLSDIRASTSLAGSVQSIGDPNTERFNFTNTGGQARYFPTVRLDFNLSSKHHLENIWNYQEFTGQADFLNNVDPAFPGFPNTGSQGSSRFTNVTALRSNLTSTIVNEARFGLTGGTILFFSEINAGQFANQGGYNLVINDALGISNATASAAPSRRNAPVRQFTDTLSWSRGSHSFNFGGSFTNVNFWSSAQTVVPQVRFGVLAADPADAAFNSCDTCNFPGATATQLTQARGLFALLTGRVTALNANAVLNETTNQYSYLGQNVQRGNQREFGFFAQDSWRVKPNLTLNLGARWEVQLPFVPRSDVYSQTTFDELFGISGKGNLFQPNVRTGKETQFTLFEKGSNSYNVDYNNIAPSFGLAYTPNFKGALGKIFGEGGQTVIRGGYSIAVVREGLNAFTSIYGANPGLTIAANRTLALDNLGPLPLLLRDPSRLTPPAFASAPIYPTTGNISNSANAFNPNLQLGYVQSWSFGVQRELNKDTVVEVRYVGNRGVKLWQQYNLNEFNLVENGFINEFKLAQANLTANQAGGRGNSFAYFGTGTGTSPLPIMLGFFTRSRDVNSPAAYTAARFTNATFVNALALNNPSPGVFAGFGTTIGASGFVNDRTLYANGVAAGFSPNFFLVNPDKLGGAFSIENNGRTWYDSVQIELRRRLSKGLLVQGNYVFAKALTNFPASSATVSFQPPTLRNVGGNKTVSPFNIVHALKVNWIYELPFGKNRWLASGAGPALDRLVGGWEFHGAARIQGGSPFNFGNVQLVGMTRNDLQKAVKMRFDDAAKIAYYLPQDIIDNTFKAFNASATSATGYGTQGPPTGRYIAPASGRNCVEAFVGQCGTNHLILYGPRFDRYDLSIVKKFRITESTNFEFRAEFLNAFNNINYIVGNPGNDVNNIGGFGVNTFGQITQAYRDVSTTNDPGGRMIQFVGRFNF